MTDQPKPSIEVEQESTERLEIIELDRAPRPEKLARESVHLEGASEVAYEERAFRPRHPATLDEVRARVDALVVKRRELPPLPAPPAPPAPAPRPIPEAQRALLQPLVPGPLVAVDAVFSSDAGDVVEAHFEADGTRRSRQFVLKDGRATPAEDVSDRVARLPPPMRTTPAPKKDDPKADAPREPAGKRKLALPFGRKKTDAAEPAAPKPDATKEGETPGKKRRFPFGGRGGA